VKTIGVFYINEVEPYPAYDGLDKNGNSVGCHGTGIRTCGVCNGSVQGEK